MMKTPRNPARWMILLVGATLALPQAAPAGKNVLRLRFDGPIVEAPPQDGDFALLFGGTKTRSLHEWVKMIETATNDSQISGIVMIIEQPSVGFAQIEELTRALRGFRDAGKKAYAFMDYAGNGSYALACAADHITLAEYSGLQITGLHAELGFYKGLLDKIGVKADMLHCGAYKSALEPFTRTEPSEEAAKNINWLLDGIYQRWIELMAEGRNLSASEIEAAVDRAPIEADDAVELKLVDAVASFADFRKMIRKQFGRDVNLVKQYPRDGGLDLELDTSNPFAFFTEMNKLMEELFGGLDEPDQPGIALIYIDGPITIGKTQSGPFGGGGNAGSTTIRAAFEKALEDENIKAVVVRVNSPGGSALASDIMWEAATRCAAEKPLVVSMGGVAGSGGYYVSLPGDVIFAEQSTITASIGVVGGKLVWQGLFEDKLGITTTEFDRGKHAGLFSMNRDWTDDERTFMKDYLVSIYDQFKGRIKQSRGDRIKGELEEMAGGRVFTGKQALELGLIDRIGGLSDAIRYASSKADLRDPEVYVLPKQKDILDIFKTMMGEETEDEYEITFAPAVSGDPLLGAILPLLHGLAPQQLQRISQDLQNLLILNRERVGCFMPFQLHVR